MHEPHVQHTLVILQRVKSDLPAVTPTHFHERIDQLLESAKVEPDITLAELEDAMITVLHDVWPYVRAYREFHERHRHELGGKLLLQRIKQELRGTLQKYFKDGGSYADLYFGRASHLFPHTYHDELHSLLIDLDGEIKRHVHQAICSHEKHAYERRVQELSDEYDLLFGHVQALKRLADQEDDPHLSSEINEHVRGIEHGLAFLGPHPDFEHVSSAHEHFEGRAREKKMKVFHRTV